MQKPDKRKICRYYARGKCVKDNCPFVHQNQTKKLCKFFEEGGYCRKGKNCQFYHSTKEEQKKEKRFIQKASDVKKYQTWTLEEKPKMEILSNLEVYSNEAKVQSESQQTKVQQKNQEKIQQEALCEKLQLRLREEQYKQLIENMREPIGEKLQFFKIYPKTFPDRSKTAEIKEHIKSLEQRFFKERSFLEIINQLQDPAQKQYYQIIRKYQDSFMFLEEDEPRIYQINLRPLLYEKQINLHFKMEEDTLNLRIDQSKYPEGKAKFEILNPSIPESYKLGMVDILNKYHSKKSLADSLKYIQNHFEKIYQKVKQSLETQDYQKKQLEKQIELKRNKIEQLEQEKEEAKFTKTEGFEGEFQIYTKSQEQNQKCADDEFFQKQEEMAQKYNKNCTNRPQKGKTSNNIASSKDQEGKKAAQKVKKQFKDYLELQFNEYEKPEHENLNYQITTQSMLMLNCAYLVVEKLLLYIECGCSKHLMYLLDAEEQKQLRICIKLKCKKCMNGIRIVWSREVIQHKATTLSRMSMVNGIIVDVGGLGWKIGCNCDEQIIKNKLHLPSERVQLNCHTCFEQITVMYQGLKHYNPFVKEFQIQENKELPLKGACNHEKLQFRWLRYACCGRVFSCDECHQVGSIKKHQKLQGITMVCGFCSWEGNVANECSKCKRDLVKGIDKAGHWQGGMGCRDQTLLSKKDAKKYSGMSKPNKKKGEK